MTDTAISSLAPDAQQLRLAVQNLACAPQAQRRYVQMGLMPRAVGNLDRIGANVEALVDAGLIDAEAAPLIGELRDEVNRNMASVDDFTEAAHSEPREYLFGHALENDAWERIRQTARRCHSLLAGEQSVFTAIMAK